MIKIIMTKMITSALLLFAVLASPQVMAAEAIESVRVWPAPDKTRIVFDLAEAPTHSYFTLYDSQPYRLVIDFHNTRNQVNLDALDFESLMVGRVRTSSPPDSSTARIVLELSDQVEPVIFALPPNERYGHRLVVDIPGQSVPEQRVTRSADRLPEREVIVAIDAGHGGEDPGSIGPSGVYEKNITLPVATKLAALINADPGMKAVLVRTGDYGVPLNQRTRVARGQRADMFISIHADAFTSPQPRGASVWVLSRRRANSELGRWLENREQHSELLGGAAEVLSSNGDDIYLARTLLDMSLDSSMSGGFDAANIFIDQLSTVTRLHSRQPQAASLAVLNSPDIPSVLVELGFISNPHEETQMRNSAHQQRLAEALYRGTREFFVNHPLDGTILANQTERQHTVKSGESLSILAQRYGTTVRAIQRRNNLSSTTLRVGQVLDIPIS
ncbi:N-acetylmuramoyl-L-alanine amidase [Aliidiomarina soli]|uniref:N-acetylmuramoyl-L-alanine amidase n=2 Tax=Aliidiomarina soli TaxID=1928574 RepID=A0A432WJV5_9GAMM|nr:N-acetylmuramoyl-L-alanine amidase [Aliidiomarina soli]